MLTDERIEFEVRATVWPRALVAAHPSTAARANGLDCRVQLESWPDDAHRIARTVRPASR
jgi:hypothetical protein